MKTCINKYEDALLKNTFPNSKNWLHSRSVQMEDHANDNLKLSFRKLQQQTLVRSIILQSINSLQYENESLFDYLMYCTPSSNNVLLKRNTQFRLI